LAMTVASNDVSSQEINSDHSAESSFNPYPRELCRNLVLWAWSRRPHQVNWMSGADELIRSAAISLGERYVEQPPLIQAANIRVKLARVAVALAARTFSTRDGEHIEVDHRHVEDAVRFIDRLYSMQGFGYADFSGEMIEDARLARSNMDQARTLIHNTTGLGKFLRSQSSFRKQDLQDMLNQSSDSISDIINQLWTMQMIRKEQADFRVNPVLHEILREKEV